MFKKKIVPQKIAIKPESTQKSLSKLEVNQELISLIEGTYVSDLNQYYTGRDQAFNDYYYKKNYSTFTEFYRAKTEVQKLLDQYNTEYEKLKTSYTNGCQELPTLYKDSELEVKKKEFNELHKNKEKQFREPYAIIEQELIAKYREEWNEQRKIAKKEFHTNFYNKLKQELSVGDDTTKPEVFNAWYC